MIWKKCFNSRYNLFCQSYQQEEDEKMDDEVHEIEKSEEAENESIEQV